MNKEALVQKFRDKGLLPKAPKRNFTPEEALQLQEINRLVEAKKYEVAQVKLNTALIPRGKEVLEEQEAVLRVLENARSHYVSTKFSQCGYTHEDKVSVNMSTGEIVPTHD